MSDTKKEEKKTVAVQDKPEIIGKVLFTPKAKK